MAPKFDAWLGEFVETELRAVIAWKTVVKLEPGLEQAQQDRFSDDGSNLRSVVTSPTLTERHKVQIIKVLSVGDPASVLLSDGVTQIRALLGEDAIAALQEELDGPFNVSTRGDLFIIRDMTIVSTPWGSPDGHIQLSIDELEYDRHLRKYLGDPSPIEQRVEVERSIRDIAEIRQKQNAVGDMFDLQSSAEAKEPLDADPQASQDIAAQVSSSQMLMRTRKRPRSMSSSQDASTKSIGQSHIATQAPAKTATLNKDGFEVESGVNLARPKRPKCNLNTAQSRNASQQSDPRTTDKCLHLLGLLSKPSAPSTHRHTEPKQVSPSRAGSASSSEREQDRPDLERSSSKDSECQHAASQGVVLRPIDVRSISPHDVSAGHGLSDHDYEGQFAPSDLVWEEDVEDASLEQQRLLDDLSCWLPPRTGALFPIPNVPVSILRRWQDLLDTERTLVNVVSSGSDNVSLQGDDSETSSADTPSEEQQIPWSQSPRRDILPPDSTLDSEPRPVPTQDDPSRVCDCASGPASRLPDTAIRAPPPAPGTFEPHIQSKLPVPSSARSYPLAPARPRAMHGKPEMHRHSPQPLRSQRTNRWPGSGSGEYQSTASSQHSSHGPQTGQYSPPRIRNVVKPSNGSYGSTNESRSGNPSNRPWTNRETTFSRPGTPQDMPRHSHPKPASNAALNPDRALPNPDRQVPNRHSEIMSRNAAERKTLESANSGAPNTQSDSPSLSCASSLGSQVPFRPPQSQHAALAHSPARMPASPGEVMIKGTQYTNTDDEMEVDVPRPLDVTTITHHNRRPERVQPGRRENVSDLLPEKRKPRPKDTGLSMDDFDLNPFPHMLTWVQASLERDPQSDLLAKDVMTEYCRVNPGPSITYKMLKMALRKVFPGTETFGNMALRLRFVGSHSSRLPVPPDAQIFTPRKLILPTTTGTQVSTAQDDRREKWIADQFVVSHDNTPYLKTVPEAYISAHPHESIPNSQRFWPTLIRKVFPDLYRPGPPYGLRRKIAAPSQSARDQIPANVADRAAVDTPRSNSRVLDDGRIPRRMPQDSVRKSSESRPVHSSPVQTSAAIGRSQQTAQARARLPPTSSVKRQVSVVDLTQAEIPQERQSNDNPRRSNGLSGRQLSVSERGFTEAVTSPSIGVHDQRMSPFQEYAQAWSDVKPGGSFAQQQMTDQQQRHEGKKIDTLSWGW